jgi:hypothetical protein
MDKPDERAGIDNEPREIRTARCRTVLLIVWASGAGTLILGQFVTMAAQSAADGGSPLAWGDLFEVAWLVHILAVPAVLLGTPLATRVLGLNPIRAPNSGKRFCLGLGCELLALLLIFTVYILVRGGVILADVSIPRALIIVTLPVWVLLALLFWPLGRFVPRPAIPTSNEVESALRGILPATHQGSFSELANVLIDIVSHANEPDYVQSILRNVSGLATMLHALAGQQIRAGTSVMGFGSDNTFGQVTVRDVVGGNQIIINLNVAGTSAVGARKEP